MHAVPGSGTVRDQILLLRGRAGLTQREVAALLGVSRPALQKWEAGEGYPSPTRLRDLIALYLERSVFIPGREEQEAMALWEALRREAAHRTPPFDAAWFAGLRTASPAGPAGPPLLPTGAPEMGGGRRLSQPRPPPGPGRPLPGARRLHWWPRGTGGRGLVGGAASGGPKPHAVL